MYDKIKTYLECNIQLCGMSYLNCVFYDFYNHELYDMNEIEKIIDKILSNKIECSIPASIFIWREYCKRDANMKNLIKRMNGQEEDHLMAYRFHEYVSFGYSPIDKYINKTIMNDILSNL